LKQKFWAKGCLYTGKYGKYKAKGRCGEFFSHFLMCHQADFEHEMQRIVWL